MIILKKDNTVLVGIGNYTGDQNSIAFTFNSVSELSRHLGYNNNKKTKI